MSGANSTYIVTLGNVSNTGAPQMAVYYATALREAGYRVLLAHGGSEQERADSRILVDMNKAGVECHYIADMAMPFRASLPRRVAALAGSQCSAVIGFTQRDRCVALLAAAQRGAAGVLSVQNQHVFNGFGPIPWLKERYYRNMLQRHCELALCTSEIVIEEMAVRFGLDRARLKALPNGIDVARFGSAGAAERLAVRSEHGVAADTELLLAVGRLEPQKGTHDLVEAFGQLAERHPRMELWIAGGISTGAAARRSAEFAASVESLIQKLGLQERIKLLGEVRDIPALHAAADLYVHPAHWEGWPLALMEAMAAGKPAIFTDCFGVLEGFEERVHGCCVPTRRVDQFTAAIDWMLSQSRRQREQIGRAGQQLVREHYSIATTSKRFVKEVEAAAAGAS